MSLLMRQVVQIGKLCPMHLLGSSLQPKRPAPLLTTTTPTALTGDAHVEQLVQAPRAQQRRIQQVGAVGGADEEDVAAAAALQRGDRGLGSWGRQGGEAGPGGRTSRGEAPTAPAWRDWAGARPCRGQLTVHPTCRTAWAHRTRAPCLHRLTPPPRPPVERPPPCPTHLHAVNLRQQLADHPVHHAARVRAAAARRR